MEWTATRKRHFTPTKLRRMRIGTAWLFALVVVLALATGIFIFRQSLRDGYEIFSIRYFPSAERAYGYGEEHFAPTNPADYDPVRAERFFLIAARLDPKYPYVNHQLARLEFLQGHYNTAVLYIDKQIELFGTTTPKAYYVKGLIEGFNGDYKDSEKDYRTYINADPTNWAATNDLAWVLLKAGKSQEALDAIDKVILLWPRNPWLLNSRATALYELGRIKEAHDSSVLAMEVVATLTAETWSKAYPGNDPLMARGGLADFQKAVAANMHSISLALKKENSSVR